MQSFPLNWGNYFTSADSEDVSFILQLSSEVNLMAPFKEKLFRANCIEPPSQVESCLPV
jgi:hypothetical protein